MTSDEQHLICPGCGEPAVPQPPADLVPRQAHGLAVPEWSHRDRSSLCPVIGPAGYEPAQPQPAGDQAGTKVPRLVPPDADLPPARLTVVGLTVAPPEPGEATILRHGRALIGVTAGFATSDDLARLALAATDGGLELLGVIVVNPDDRDATIGEAIGPRRPSRPATLDTTWSAEPVVAVDSE